MLEVGRDLDLAEEPLGSQGSGQLGPKDLHGHGAVMPEILGEVDGRHPAMTELALEAVPVGQPGPKAIGDVGHGESCG
jgi:hypothetical protein